MKLNAWRFFLKLIVVEVILFVNNNIFRYPGDAMTGNIFVATSQTISTEYREIKWPFILCIDLHSNPSLSTIKWLVLKKINVLSLYAILLLPVVLIQIATQIIVAIIINHLSKYDSAINPSWYVILLQIMMVISLPH